MRSVFRRWSLLFFVACLPAGAWAQAPVRIAMIETLSGPLAAGGEAALRNLVWATERVNARGGVKLSSGARSLQMVRYDSKGQVEEALAALRSAIDDGIRIVMQGNSSAVAAALIDAIGKHNEREPGKRVIFLNYAAVDPVLTNERCSFCHFRFDAHADMRMAALMQVLREDRAVQKVYLIGQDYSFGQAVLREGRRQLALVRPDVQIVGDELHPLGRVKDFIPYATKIKASGAQAVLTGNFGSDLTLLVRAARDVGFEGKFYTFYGNALGVPGVLAEAGVGKVVAVAEWFANVPGEAAQNFYQSFRQRFPRPQDDYIHMRMQLMMEALVQSIEKAQSLEAFAMAHELGRAEVSLAGHAGRMRSADHQFQQPLRVVLMDRQGSPGVRFDAEGSGFGFRVIRSLNADQAEQTHSCKMERPQR